MRQILVVDVLLAHYARTLTVAELEAVAARIVRTLNAPDPKGAHERRFLFMSQLPDGSWRGRFECGPEQGLRIKRALAAFSAPRPGAGIDADGVRHDIPDTRDLGARQIDAVTDIITLALAKTGLTLPDDQHSSGSNAPNTRPTDGLDDTAGPKAPTAPTPTAPTPTAPTPAGSDSDGSDSDGSDIRRGRLRRPRLRRADSAVDPTAPSPTAPTPTAAARRAGSGVRATRRTRTQSPTSRRTSRRRVRAKAWCCASPGRWSRRTRARKSWWSPASNTSPPPGATAPTLSRSTSRRTSPAGYATASPTASAWIKNKPAGQAPVEESVEGHPAEDSGEEHPGEDSGGNSGGDSGEECTEERPGQAAPGEHARPDQRTPTTRNGERPAERAGGDEPGLGWLARALSPYGIPARLDHAGLVDPDTLELLACNATIRAACSPIGGALLDLGRSQRLASPAQKTALLARDGGCVIPGCTVPGDACDAHHVIWWTRGGPTDLNNMALLCGRHHTEVHQGTWEIQIRDGIPWVTPPSWIDRTRRPLRNAAHRPGSRAA